MSELTARQQQILNTSISIIAQEGIQNLTTKNLSAKISVSEAALYRHYDSKHSILMGILDMFKEFSEMPEIPDGKELSPVDKIELFLTDRYDKEHSEKSRLIMHGHKEIIVKFIKEGMKNGSINKDLDPVSVFRTIIGSMRLLVTQWCYNGNTFDLKKEGMKLWYNIKIMIQ
jgi:AcrR family transcriptional regulator